MNKYFTYDDMEITIEQATAFPCYIVSMACDITQKKELGGTWVAPDKSQLIEYLFTANHTSPFEHCYITFLISNVSRSFLAQITRHRMGSFTAASQHYQKYNAYPNILDPHYADFQSIRLSIDQANETYQYLISIGVPKEEARQILPNAKAVNILWTVNARSLINFFNQRLCRRNVNEMFTFALKLKILCLGWFPELFKHIGPDCEVLGGCTQGKMKAKECINAKIPNFKRRNVSSNGHNLSTTCDMP